MAAETPGQNTILGFGIDPGDSKQVLKGIATAASEMGKEISNAADLAAQKLQKQATAQDAAAKQSKRSTDAAIRTLQTEIAAREAGGRATARYYELIYANSSKVDQQAIAPLIAKYKELEAQQKAASEAVKRRAAEEIAMQQDLARRVANAQPQRAAGLPDISQGTKQLEQMGMTAKATAAALRQVPAQFTDIVVSLQGGQAPLTVLLQQGGQLKDVFGGVGAAAQALGKYMLGLVNPLSLTVAALAAVGYAAYQSAEDTKALNTVLITTGNRAATTSAELRNIAEATTKSGYSISASSAALVEFAKAGVSVGERLQSITQLALDLDRYGGTAVKDTAAAFASLADDPVKGSLKLNESLNYLTKGVLENIDALVRQGDKLGAARVAQEAYAEAARNSVTALKANLGPLDTALDFYTRKGIEMWNALRGLVGPDTGNEQLRKLEQQLSGVRAALSQTPSAIPGQEGAAARELLAQEKSLLNQISYINRVNGAAAQSVKLQQEKTREVQATAEWMAKYTTATQKQAAEEARIREVGKAAGKSAAEIEAAVLASRPKAGAPKGEEIGEQRRDLASYVEALQGRINKEQDLTEVQRAQLKLSSLGTVGEVAQVREMVLGLAEEADAREVATKAAQDAEKALKAYNAEYIRSADAVESTLQKYKDEAAATQIMREQKVSLAVAVNEVTLARLEELLVAERADNNKVAVAAIEREIEARKRLGAQLRNKDAREAIEKSASDAAKAWEKASDQIGQSITDALFRGFESGKSFVQNLIDVTRNAFATLILKPTIQATVQSVANTVGGALGIPGAQAGGFNPLTNFGGFAGDAASRAGQFLINNTNNSILGDFGASLVSSSKSIGEFASAIGDGIGYINAAVALSEGKVGQALGSAVGTYFGGPIGSAIGNEIGKAIDGLFDGSGYVGATGSATVGFDAAGAVTSKNQFGNSFDFATKKADDFVAGLLKAYTNAATNLGIKTKGGAFAFGSNDSEGGKFGLNVAVGTSRYAVTDVKATDAALQLEASRAVFAALQGSELPKYLEGVFDNLDAATATTEQINAAIAYAQGIAGLNDQFKNLPFAELQDLSSSATKGLIEFAGGLDRLGSGLTTYYNEFFSAEERRNQTIKSITQRLAEAGVNVDVAALTREAYRGIVEGQDLATEAGQQAYAALIEVSGAFAGLNPILKDTEKAVDAVADAQKKWADEVEELNKIAADRNKADLERQLELRARLDVATGRYTQRQVDMQRELAETTDYATQALIREVYAQEDIAAARTKVEDIRAQVTQNYLAAQERVTAAQKNLASQLQSTVRSFEDFLGTLDGAQTPTVRLAGARQSFDDLTTRARAGDTVAIGQLTTSAKTFLDLSKGYSASIQDYRRDEIKVRQVLQEGIAAGQEQLLKLPAEMRDATDPLRAAYLDLEKATGEESAARTLAIATQASLTDTEKTLGEKYLEAIKGLPEGEELASFYNNTFAAVEAAAAIAKAAASAAEAVLAGLVQDGYKGQGGGPLPTMPAPVGGTISGASGVSITDGLVRKDGEDGTSLFWARDVAAQLNEYAAANGPLAATARAVELGATDSILEELRKYSVGVPQFAKGINYVPDTMAAIVHKGERILPAADNTQLMESLRNPNMAGDVLAAEVKALREEVARLRADNSAENTRIVVATQKSAKVLDQWNNDGMPLERTV